MLDGVLDPFLLWISTEESVLSRLQAIRKTVAGDAQILDSQTGVVWGTPHMSSRQAVLTC